MEEVEVGEVIRDLFFTWGVEEGWVLLAWWLVLVVWCRVSGLLLCW
jgi:hypothetical protein